MQFLLIVAAALVASVEIVSATPVASNMLEKRDAQCPPRKYRTCCQTVNLNGESNGCNYARPGYPCDPNTTELCCRSCTRSIPAQCPKCENVLA